MSPSGHITVSFDKKNGRNWKLYLYLCFTLCCTLQRGFHLPNLRPVSMVITGQNLTPLRSSGTPPSLHSLDIMSPRTPADSNISLKSELGDLESPDVTDRRRSGRKVGTCDKEQLTDNIMVKEFGTTPSKSLVSSLSLFVVNVMILKWDFRFPTLLLCAINLDPFLTTELGFYQTNYLHNHWRSNYSPTFFDIVESILC